MSIDNRLLEIGGILERVKEKYDKIENAIEIDNCQNDEGFEYLLAYNEIDEADWKAIEHMGEMEALEKRWKFLKELLGDFEADISSWGYTDLDSVKRVIEIIDFHVSNNLVTDKFLISLVGWVDKEYCNGYFEGIKWDV
tara:strand:- start:1007 stop:1423 length:417 start_codon:yes stop_codon:yes gene_type:complete